jgi:hypothetical protein
LRKILVPAENYNGIARLTPSKPDIISPVGPGLHQDFGQSVRGRAFPSTSAPQPGIYFTSNDISDVSVHRGLGQAPPTVS